MVVSRVLPNVVSFNAAISAAHWHFALKTFEDIGKAVISFNTVLSACEKAGQWQATPGTGTSVTLGDIVAMVLCFEEMTKEEVLPDVISYNAVISSFAKGKQWRRALKIFDTMQLDHKLIHEFQASLASKAKDY
eukprot:Skav215650  [mRNA]  locus=scaffold1588:103067:106206:+ [translate_table: standard]